MAVPPSNFTSHNISCKIHITPAKNSERRDHMSPGTVCGQTLILDLAADVREHLAAKGYKERDLIRLQKIWNHFARYADNCHFTIEIGAAFLRDAYGIEWAEFPPPMKRHQRRSVSAIRYLRDYELILNFN